VGMGVGAEEGEFTSETIDLNGNLEGDMGEK
jgi:hypothetical protein